MLGVAWVASSRPLLEASGRPLSAPSAMAWRAALWLFLLAAVSGFAMGSRLRHSVGGDDGGLADERGQSSIDPAIVNTATILLRLEAAKPLVMPPPKPHLDSDPRSRR
jgi:hypothetical protein